MDNPTTKLAFSVAEAAAAIGVSAPTLYSDIKAGRFPAVKIGQRRWVVPIRSLEEWLAAHVVTQNRDIAK